MTDKVNYAAMSDAEINSEVAKFKYPTSGRSTPYRHRPDVEIYHPNGTSERKDYCNSWADAGQIIAENGIGIMPFKKRPARAWPTSIGLLTKANVEDNNPLRAAMIVFLMMQEQK